MSLRRSSRKKIKQVIESPETAKEANELVKEIVDVVIPKKKIRKRKIWKKKTK